MLIFLVSKGRSHLLLRDIDEEKTIKGLRKIKEKQSLEINAAEDKIDRLNREILILQAEIAQQNLSFKEEEKHRQLLSNLYDKGVIDENGNYINEENDEDD